MPQESTGHGKICSKKISHLNSVHNASNDFEILTEPSILILTRSVLGVISDEPLTLNFFSAVAQNQTPVKLNLIAARERNVMNNSS